MPRVFRSDRESGVGWWEQSHWACVWREKVRGNKAEGRLCKAL